MEKRRVVITGMGSVTPFGTGVENFWNNIIEGNSGIDTVSEYNLDLEKQTTHIFGEVKNFNPEDYMDAKDAKRTDRFIQFALVAGEEAYKDADLEHTDIDPYRIGVIVSSAAGGFITTEANHITMLKRGYTKCSPFTIPMMIADMASGKLSIKYGFKGINKAVLSACATGSHSIGDAFRAIQYNDADMMLAGGSEATICNMGVGAFSAARTLSKHNDEPQKASRPYDKDRDGFIMGEGAGVLVLEELEHAKARGAKIYAEIVGYGQTADAYDIVAPASSGESAAKAMELALKDANIDASKVNYINTHGTSTGLGDIAESRAIAKVFGELDTNKDLHVSSTKSMHGHLLGAAGAIEAIACIKAICNDIVPPTINLDNQDENVANLNYVPHKAQKTNVEYALSNSFGFGGHNATLLFKKYN